MIISQIISFEEIACGTCGILHAVPKDWIAKRRAEGGDIHCPNGCCRTWRETDADRLRKQLAAKECELREAKCETLRQNQLLEKERLDREKVEKKLRRVNNGVCPCCKRHFTNLARHMVAKHANLNPRP